MKKLLLGAVLLGVGLLAVEPATYQVGTKQLVVGRQIWPSEGLWINLKDPSLREGVQATFTFRVVVLLQSGKYLTIKKSTEFDHRFPLTVWLPAQGVEKIVSIHLKEEHEYIIE